MRHENNNTKDNTKDKDKDIASNTKHAMQRKQRCARRHSRSRQIYKYSRQQQFSQEEMSLLQRKRGRERRSHTSSRSYISIQDMSRHEIICPAHSSSVRTRHSANRSCMRHARLSRMKTAAAMEAIRRKKKKNIIEYRRHVDSDYRHCLCG